MGSMFVLSCVSLSRPVVPLQLDNMSCVSLFRPVVPSNWIIGPISEVLYGIGVPLATLELSVTISAGEKTNEN